MTVLRVWSQEESLLHINMFEIFSSEESVRLGERTLWATVSSSPQKNMRPSSATSSVRGESGLFPFWH